MSKKLTVAVCGATGAVGREMLKTLHDRNFPASEVLAFASARSEGVKVPYGDTELTVHELKEDSFVGVDIAIFSAGGATSTKFSPYAAHSGCVVVDNSAAWRMDDRCPLVVPEVNPEDLEWHNGIIANPNCSTIQMLVALKPIHDAVHIKRIVVTTFQTVSGAGQKGINELEQQVRDLFNSREIKCDKFPYRIAFNVLPQIDIFLDNDYTKEEMKMLNETRKIMGVPNVLCSTTCVRVPVMRAHSVAINAEFEKPVSVERAREVIAAFPGAELDDDVSQKKYPMPLMYQRKVKCGVGRIRKDLAFENGLSFWVAGDQLWKGAALNAVQIAECLVK